eukprot:NODE_3559_length_946_cov_6.377289_g3407_i0.p1 GENE.NODE_3559_length_946_cov_6.377289_g3407_i0~~NODE_3559_length_946_cov_6.377289_g3407_i0.p1  ORF type:complete len:275 (-),score=94.03 NODE_3559_length_946_cov_6.377289_g3407_i0:59-883(-)
MSAKKKSAGKPKQAASEINQRPARPRSANDDRYDQTLQEFARIKTKEQKWLQRDEEAVSQSQQTEEAIARIHQEKLGWEEEATHTQDRLQLLLSFDPPSDPSVQTDKKRRAKSPKKEEKKETSVFLTQGERESLLKDKDTIVELLVKFYKRPRQAKTVAEETPLPCPDIVPLEMYKRVMALREQRLSQEEGCAQCDQRLADLHRRQEELAKCQALNQYSVEAVKHQLQQLEGPLAEQIRVKEEEDHQWLVLSDSLPKPTDTRIASATKNRATVV